MRYLNGFSLNLMTLPEKTASFLTILLEHRNTIDATFRRPRGVARQFEAQRRIAIGRIHFRR